MCRVRLHRALELVDNLGAVAELDQPAGARLAVLHVMAHRAERLARRFLVRVGLRGRSRVAADRVRLEVDVPAHAHRDDELSLQTNSSTGRTRGSITRALVDGALRFVLALATVGAAAIAGAALAIEGVKRSVTLAARTRLLRARLGAGQRDRAKQRFQRQAVLLSGATKPREVAAAPGVSRPPRRVIRVGALAIDTNTREVRVGPTSVALTAMEYALLAHPAGDPRRVFTKSELLRDVWRFRLAGRTRTLDTHACRLRHKLCDATG
jgi:hypothetical protein